MKLDLAQKFPYGSMALRFHQQSPPRLGDMLLLPLCSFCCNCVLLHLVTCLSLNTFDLILQHIPLIDLSYPCLQYFIGLLSILTFFSFLILYGYISTVLLQSSTTLQLLPTGVLSFVQVFQETLKCYSVECFNRNNSVSSLPSTQPLCPKYSTILFFN